MIANENVLSELTEKIYSFITDVSILYQSLSWVSVMLTTKKVYFLTIISGALPCRSIAKRGLELQSPHVMGSYEYTYSDAKEQKM